jgi:hypothetical protein
MAMVSMNLAMIASPFDTRHDFTLRVGIFPTRVLRMMIGGAMGINKGGAIEKDPARDTIYCKFKGIFFHENSHPLVGQGSNGQPIVVCCPPLHYIIIYEEDEKATKSCVFSLQMQ